MTLTRRRLLTLSSGLAATAGLWSFWVSRMRNYDGPPSDHFDGTHFFDPNGAPPKSLGDVLRWQFGRKRQRQPWPAWSPSPYDDVPPRSVVGENVRLSFVGHASWLIQTSGQNILIDPIWS